MVQELDSVIEKLEREIRFLEACKHKNIVNFYESFIHGMKLFIVMEFCSGGSLQNLIRKFS